MYFKDVWHVHSDYFTTHYQILYCVRQLLHQNYIINVLFCKNNGIINSESLSMINETIIQIFVRIKYFIIQDLREFLVIRSEFDDFQSSTKK